MGITSTRSLERIFPALQGLPNFVLSERDRTFLSKVAVDFGGRCPDLQEIWRLMDRAWIECGCDPGVLDGRVVAFYSHPVWLLNGLFIEQHPMSMEHREHFADWAISTKPSRIADYGGGFGALAMMLAKRLPGTLVDVVEPHAHPAALARASGISNMRYVAELEGEYDLIVATDVFEHVKDPVTLAAGILASLRIGGRALIANCFAPVILCHLPEHFHLRASWPAVMRALGLTDLGRVVYGRGYCRKGDIDLAAAKAAEIRSRQLHQALRFLPAPLSRTMLRMLMSAARHTAPSDVGREVGSG